MNLSDYQKSGNAFGVNVTEYPSYSVLKGKIPDIPGITNTPFIDGYIFKADMVYNESTYGSKYQIVTSNGIVFYNPTAGASLIEKKYVLAGPFQSTRNTASDITVEGLTSLGFLDEEALFQGSRGVTGVLAHDPLRQSLGAVPFQYPGGNYRLLNDSKNSEFGIESYCEPHPPVFSRGIEYPLPDNYYIGGSLHIGAHYGISTIQFSRTVHSPFQGKAVPGQASVFPNGKDNKGGFEKSRVFNFKKEMYVSIKSRILDQVDGKTIDITDPTSYPEAITRHKMMFFSLFFGIPEKANGYTYNTFNESGEAFSNRLMFNNFFSPFDYDKTIERPTVTIKDGVSLAPGGQTNIVSFYDTKMKNNSIAGKEAEFLGLSFGRFKEIEEIVFEDNSFEVEGSITTVKYESIKDKSAQPGAFVKKEMRLKAPSGIPVNPIALSLDTDNGYLTADVTGHYKYLNIFWENAQEMIPEISYPNIYDFLGKGGDTGLLLKEAYSDLANKAINCFPYEDFVEFGKNKKLIYFGSPRMLDNNAFGVFDVATSAGTKTIQNVIPMFAKVEFDYYENAPREIHNILHKDGIYKDLLLSMLTLIYTPKAEYEVARMISKESESILDPAVKKAHEKISLYLQAANAYFLESAEEQRRITTVKDPGGSMFAQTDAISMLEEESLSIDFERWYQYYLNFLEFEYNAEAPDAPSVNIIDPFDYQEFLTQYLPEQITDAKEPPLESPSEMNLFQPLKVAESVERLNEIFQKHMRELNAIFSKHPSYSEPIMYRIEKFDFNGNSIQNIFIPHFAKFDQFQVNLIDSPHSMSPSIRPIIYYDTQVRYGQIYRYKITQYRIVVGTKYRYIFSNHEKTDSYATMLGYGDKYQNDVVFNPIRHSFEEGSIIEDFYKVPDPSTLPGAYKPDTYTGAFILYSKKSELDEHEPILGTDLSIFPKAVTVRDLKQFNKLAVFKCIAYPSLKIEEVPYYEEEIAIVDFPPIPPNVNFDPLVGKGSKILMTFENQTGDREEIPIVVETSDSGLFSLQRTAQGRNKTNADGSYVIPSLRFKSDDFPKAYQIFKIDYPPLDYSDFSGNLYKELDVEEATAIKEDLEPNKTFYYMFRSVDVHDNISNPSAVFAVQMVFNSGVYYPVVEVYEFGQANAGYRYKSFQQYLKIEAALIQRMVNKEKSNITDDSSIVKEPVLGIGTQSLWNQKKFKFRIISKHTGKMIDINVKFKTNHTQPIDQNKLCL